MTIESAQLSDTPYRQDEASVVLNLEDAAAKIIAAGIAASGRGSVITSHSEGALSRALAGQFSVDPARSDIPPEGSRGQALARAEHARSIICRNGLADLPFSQSVNPYQGCQYGCCYCSAKDVGSESGLNGNTELVYKSNAPELLEAALINPRYRCRPIILGACSDPYQPLEQEQQLTRRLLEVLSRHRHPFSIITKSRLILRDLDLLETLSRQQLCSVRISISTLDDEIKHTLEPNAPVAAQRLETIKALNRAGVPVGVLAAPLIPKITDHELEAMLQSSRDAGAKTAAYGLIRLSGTAKVSFEQWLQRHYPGRASHVMGLVRQAQAVQQGAVRKGAQVAAGYYTDMIAQRFRLACSRLGLINGEGGKLNCERFRQPPGPGQLTLF